MTTEAAPSTVVETAAVDDAEMFAPIDGDSIAEAGGENPRLLTRTALRVAGLADSFGDKARSFGESLEDRRTASEVLSDLGDSARSTATEALNNGREYVDKKIEAGRKILSRVGAKATKNFVTVITAPARAGEKLANSMEKGLNAFEARAISAKARKEQRVADRNANKAIRLQEKQDLKVAKEVKRDMKDRAKLAKETDKQQAKAEKKAEIQAKAKAAKEHKARRKVHLANMKQLKRDNRQEKRDARSERNAERTEKLKSRAKKIGRGTLNAAGVVFNSGADAAKGMGTLFAEAGREAREVGSEMYDKTKDAAKAKAEEKQREYHMKRGHKAAQRAEIHLNKAAAEGEEYHVPVVVEDGRAEK